MEKSTYSDFAYFYAAYNQGWMHRSSKRKYKALPLSSHGHSEANHLRQIQRKRLLQCGSYVNNPFAARQFYDAMVDNTLHHILRPNLIVYLDASVDAVMEKIKARGNEWDKNSPVFSNATYLNDIYTTMKKEYLAEARYAWSFFLLFPHYLAQKWPRTAETCSISSSHMT